jgi:hypothetical protein
MKKNSRNSPRAQTALDGPFLIVLKSLVQSGFFAFFGRTVDQTSPRKLSEPKDQDQNKSQKTVLTSRNWFRKGYIKMC